MWKQGLAALVLVLPISAQLEAQPQPSAPPPAGPSMLPAPPTPEPPRRSTLKPDENTASSVIGARIFTPKAGGTSNGPALGAPRKGVRVPRMSDADWDQLRRSHDDIGDVADIILAETGEARGIVLNVGAFLGVGEKPVAVDWSDVIWMQDPSGRLLGIIHRTRQELEAAPHFPRST